jgi:hypothetical protein
MARKAVRVGVDLAAAKYQNKDLSCTENPHDAALKTPGSRRPGMRDLQRIGLALTTALALAQPAFAAEMSQGEMAAAIRGADYPCQQVLELQPTGDNRWRVRCNSGTFQVTRDANGQFSVVKTD